MTRRNSATSADTSASKARRVARSAGVKLTAPHLPKPGRCGPRP